MSIGYVCLCAGSLGGYAIQTTIVTAPMPEYIAGTEQLYRNFRAAIG